MLTGWPYRIASAIGTVVLALTAVLVANHPVPQRVFTEYVPLFNRLEPTVLWGSSLVLVVGLTVGAVTLALVPLYKPRPRRVLDTVALTEKRLVASGLALAAIGFFNFSYRVPRATLVMTMGLLGLALPVWFVWIRHRPDTDGSRTIIVGDDPAQIERLQPDVDSPLLGYLCPTHAVKQIPVPGSSHREPETVVADGGDVGLKRLGGLSRLEDILVEHDIDTVVLAFHQPDRQEFFGALHACHDHGVNAKVHRDYADSVLVSEGSVGTLVDVDLKPWDAQDLVFKRLFDIAFAGSALLVLAPVIGLIALAIKIEGHGPIFYEQERTCLDGDTFIVRKFRTLIPTDSDVDLDIEEDRETPLGNFLRTTHLDEIPQLWPILAGQMSVVGPRPAITELEPGYRDEVDEWQQRWFVKPGLTGLAQINDATGHEPEKKLRYDVQYIRKQSFWFDVKIVLRQLWKVVEDVIGLVGTKESK
ncbi:sugar transferase [Natranaeroarchaeum sulfidigenes]|uniref:Sugar transferase involved in lipopolysaccharidesynthesis n=1 Tax=Natranaeroarchaeum sulfidigenes TaxID=2784880 RepID=A0A897MU42_9EURY|nr:sugar transferase [Natranaeroarchaeum sulfidigenes]QSG01716.1 Sugar transferase involved in lipopolysaccharidesynthesis [Natranaeroarchaeum sulfidigenes]